jgi:hypothetical protein
MAAKMFSSFTRGDISNEVDSFIVGGLLSQNNNGINTYIIKEGIL